MELFHLSIGAPRETVSTEREAMERILRPDSPNGLYILLDTRTPDDPATEGRLFKLRLKHDGIVYEPD